ncbi:Inorganic pyrophosphatase [hydrothermal vent metagenome]|uniref:inorganic diphosphatase n=1 Tax=hydrothermal vent metagenome TaxID=652676 RepID=A0A3B0SQD0_9ZZZZ
MAFPSPFYRWRPHPWHGLSAGDDAPRCVNAFIEITPFDVVKYEVDKETGYLKVDRPQQGSSSPPVLYGFIPRTFCDVHVAELCEGTDRSDGDPLDICVISERPINRVEVLIRARVVGGLQMIDGGEADDKIIAILDADPVWADVHDISDLPTALVSRIEHYFLSYKSIPGEPGTVSIPMIYGAEHAQNVVRAAMRDYGDTFGER